VQSDHLTVWDLPAHRTTPDAALFMQITQGVVRRIICSCSLAAAHVTVLCTHSRATLWGRRRRRRGRLLVQVDMVEIYNEELRDLLAPVNAKQKKQQSLQIKVQPNETHTYMHHSVRSQAASMSSFMLCSLTWCASSLSVRITYCQPMAQLECPIFRTSQNQDHMALQTFVFYISGPDFSGCVEYPLPCNKQCLHSACKCVALIVQIKVLLLPVIAPAP